MKNGSSGQSLSNEIVSVFFEDAAINEIFSALLEAQGVKTAIINDSDEIQGETRIITEPQFLPFINQKYFSRCLVVGNKESLKDLPTLTLSRPLTEEKIEEALSKFFES